MGKLESLYTVGWHTNWFNYFGKQFGKTSKAEDAHAYDWQLIVF